MNYMSYAEEDFNRYKDVDHGYDANEGESRTYEEFAGSHAQDVHGLQLREYL